MVDRLDYIERVVGDSFDQQKRNLAADQGRVVQFPGELRVQCATSEAYGASVDTLVRSSSSIVHHQEAFGIKRASMADKVDYLAKVFGESTEMQAREMESVKTLANEAKVHNTRLAVVEEQLQRLRAVHPAKECGDSQALEERVRYFEKALTESADRVLGELVSLGDAQSRQAAELEALRSVCRLQAEGLDIVKSTCNQHSGELEVVKTSFTHLGNMPDRLDYMENVLGEWSNRHIKELAAAHSKVTQLHSRISDECIAREATADGEHVQASAVAGLEAIEERLVYLKRAVDEAGDRQAKGFEERDARHAALVRRLERLEMALGRTAEEQARGLEAAHENIEQLAGRLEAAGAAADWPETAEELQATKAAFAKFASETKAREAYQSASYAKLAGDFKELELSHSRLVERTASLETSVGQSSGKYAEGLLVVHSKMEELRKYIFQLGQRHAESREQRLHESHLPEAHVVRELATQLGHMEAIDSFGGGFSVAAAARAGLLESAGRHGAGVSHSRSTPGL